MEIKRKKLIDTRIFLGSVIWLIAVCTFHINVLSAQNKIVQTNIGNNNINIQSVGSYNTVIGVLKVSHDKVIINKTVKVVRPDYAEVEIMVNTKSDILEGRRPLV